MERKEVMPSADLVCGLSIEELARWAFRDEAAAKLFLDLPNPALGDKVPRDLAQTEAGAREVEAVLVRFMHGDYT